MNRDSVVVTSATLRGVEALSVEVEVSTSKGIPGLDIVGMPDSQILEARTRVRCALRSAGFSLPRERITINLAPGEIKKTGTGFDLPIAVAILVSTGQISPLIIKNAMFVGELGLDGSVCKVRGDVAYAILAKQENLRLITSRNCTLCSNMGFDVRGLGFLSQLKSGTEGLSQISDTSGIIVPHSCIFDLDFADVVDQELAKRAMVITAAGRHGMLMIGPPGSGKTMLAKRLPSIMDPMDKSEIAESMLIHSVAGQPIDRISQGERPFRAPHHSVSLGGLVGGGRPVLPGEISLAHNGILFLDEFPEFGRNALQAMRQPMEDKEVRIVRVDGVYTFPSDFQLIAAANPCPCGHLGDPGHECSCSPARINAYQSKIGGPLLDRIDVVIDVARPKSKKVIYGLEGTDSAHMRESVREAHEFEQWRKQHRSYTDSDPLSSCDLQEDARQSFESLADGLALGGRAIVRIARVARTIADLEKHLQVTTSDIVEAVGFRSRSQN